MQERLLAGSKAISTPSWPASASSDALEREEVGRLAAAAPGPRRQRADREAADPVRLATGADRSPGKLAGEDVEVAFCMSGMRRLSHGQVDAAGLEEGDGVGAAGEVALGDVEQRAEQGRPHRRLVLGERVGENDAFGARIVGGDPQPPGLAGSVKLQPTTSSKPRSRIASSARRRSRWSRLSPPTCPATAGRVLGRCSSRPWTRADLLDQVDLAGDVVVAVGRHRRPRGRRPSASTPKPSRSR